MSCFPAIHNCHCDQWCDHRCDQWCDHWCECVIINVINGVIISVVPPHTLTSPSRCHLLTPHTHTTTTLPPTHLYTVCLLQLHHPIIRPDPCVVEERALHPALLILHLHLLQVPAAVQGHTVLQKGEGGSQRAWQPAECTTHLCTHTHMTSHAHSTQTKVHMHTHLSWCQPQLDQLVGSHLCSLQAVAVAGEMKNAYMVPPPVGGLGCKQQTQTPPPHTHIGLVCYHIMGAPLPPPP